MPGSENLILTVATRRVYDSDGFRMFVRSLGRLSNPTDVRVLSPDVPPGPVESPDNVSIYVEKAKIPSLFRDRHLAFRNYLNECGHRYNLVLSCDCRDLVFQNDPFDWVGRWAARYGQIAGRKEFLRHFVVLTLEGFMASRSGFARIEHFNFEADVPPELRHDGSRQAVVNAGVALGTPRALQDYHMLVWAACLKTRGNCSDQATVNWLWRYLDEDDAYVASHPQHDDLCLTGEGVKEGVSPWTIKAGKICNQTGESYCILHQYDRVPEMKALVIEQFSF